VSVSSSEKQLLCISDAFLHPIHIEHPEWHAAIDMVPDQLTNTRHLLLNKVATEKALMLAFHFPFPGVGHIVQRKEGWRWQPLRTK
jgi:hypothetical protein